MAKRNIQICMGSSCFSRGNNINAELLKKYLTDNGLQANVSFTGRLCTDICGRGPVVSIDDRIYEEVNASRLYKILEEEFGC